MSEIGEKLKLAIDDVPAHAKMCGDALNRLAAEEKEIKILKADQDRLNYLPSELFF